MNIGPSSVTFTDYLNLFLPRDDDQFVEYVIINIRLPRTLLAVFIGGGIGLCGAVLQLLLQNRLAEPSVTGASGAAACAAVGVIFFRHELAEIGINTTFLRTLLAMAAAAITLGIVASVISMSEFGHSETIILVGLAFNSIFASCIGWLTYAANDVQLRDITFWTLGSVAGHSKSDMAVALVIIALASIGLLFMSRRLNFISAGTSFAAMSGLSIPISMLILLALTSMIVGVSVSVAGMISFVGLMAPNIARQVVGVDALKLILSSFGIGAIIMLGSDILLRLVFDNIEPPIGVFLGVIGAPFFIWILLTTRKLI